MMYFVPKLNLKIHSELVLPCKESVRTTATRGRSIHLYTADEACTVCADTVCMDSDSGHSPLLVNLPRVLEWASFLDNLQVVVLPVARATFLFFQSNSYECAWTEHSENSSFCSSGLLRLTLHVQGVNNSLCSGFSSAVSNNHH